LLGQLEGPRYSVQGETGNLRAIAGEGDGYKHILLWRYEGDGPDEIELRLEVEGVRGRNSRIVALDPNAAMNNIRVLQFGRSDQLGNVSIKLKPWDIRWIEIE
jgi:hypothetical protein